jgi:putative monooxygenase
MSIVQENRYRRTLADIKPITDKGGAIFVLLSPKTVQTAEMIMGIANVPVGEHVTEHAHDYSEECLFVLQGEGTLFLDHEEQVALEPGCAVRIPRGRRHWIDNTGSVDLRVVFSAAPLAPTAKAGDRITADSADKGETGHA